MAGTRAGGLKAIETQRRELGEDGLAKHLEEMGRKGGQAKVLKGFARMSPAKQRAASQKGGKAPRKRGEK